MAARTVLSIAGAIAVALSLGSAQAQDLPEESPEKPSFVVKALIVAGGGKHSPHPLGGGTISLIGEPDSKSFGVSFNGTLAPKAVLTGKEKLVALLYLNCEGAPETRIMVGSIDLGALRSGHPETTLFAAADGTAFVPLANVTCASLTLHNDEPEKTPYVVKSFSEKELPVAEDVAVMNATVNLIGEPDSKNFGISYRGTLTPSIEMNGEETLVAHLYMNCDTKTPRETSAINVGTAKVGEVTKGRTPSLLIATTDVSAFVPLKDIDCVKLGLQ